MIVNTVSAPEANDVDWSIAQITFDSAFAGKTYTLTNGEYTYSGSVPSSSPYVVERNVKGFNTTYTVSAVAHSTTYTNTVSIGQFSGIYSCTLEAFQATLNVSANIGGASVSDDNVITATNGTDSYTTIATSTGTFPITIGRAGTYTVSMTNGTDVSSTTSVNITTNGGTYSASVSYFTATLTVTVLSGNNATVTATSGSNVFTAVASGGTATVNIYKSGTYTVKGTLSGTDGLLTDSVSITTSGSSYTATVGFPSTTLNSNSWAMISKCSAKNIGNSLWAVGDRKSVALSGKAGSLSISGTYYLYILEFNHNSSREGTGISFGGFKTAASGGADVCLCDSKYGNTDTSSTIYFNMNSSKSNSGGWKSSRMRYSALGSTNSSGADAPTNTATSPVSNSLMSCLPSDLRAVMKPITVYSDNTGGGSDTASYVTATKDYLPLLAEFEIHGTRTYANSAEKNYQTQFTYYSNGNAKIKYKHDATTTAANWWCRSVLSGNSTDFCYVHNNGGANNRYANYSGGVSPHCLI